MRNFNSYLFGIIVFIFIITLPGYFCQINAAEDFDLVVYGGQPEGIMAAVAAAREGASTLIILKRKNPGGLMTYGGLNYLDLNYNKNGEIINKGLFQEWHQMVGGELVFDPLQAEKAFWKLLKAEKNLQLIKNVKLIGIKKKANDIISLELEDQAKKVIINADFFIDASQDGDLAALSGNGWFDGAADLGLSGRKMAATLVLAFDKVDKFALLRKIKAGNYQDTYYGENHAWGFLEIGQKYQPVTNQTDLRGFNIVLVPSQIDGYYKAYLNALLLFNVNPLDQKSINTAYERGKEEAKYILEYLKDELAGFKNAILSELPPELYIRESRHFLTKYQLKTSDLFTQRIFFDTITIGSYPLDYQASEINYPGFVLFNPDYYAIPLRSLMAKSFNNLLIVGRSSGYSSLAAASARVLPVGMNSAEAAGRAVGLAVSNHLNLDDILHEKKYLHYIRNKLAINLKNYPTTNPLIDNEKALAPLMRLLGWGLTIGGYNNDFRLSEVMPEREFAGMLVKILRRRNAPTYYEWIPGSLETLSKPQLLTTQKAFMLLLAAESQRVLEIEPAHYYQRLLDRNLIPNELENTLKLEETLTREEAYILLSHFAEKYPVPARLKRFRGE